jgi:hypothetical protein
MQFFYRYKINLKSIVCLSTTLFFVGCVSTGLDKNLDTEVTGESDLITFSWSDNHPFSREYQSAKIALVAEYTETNLRGSLRPVRQVIQNVGRSVDGLNKKTFRLPQRLRSIPNESNICLYLAIKNQPIPIRSSANVTETARFKFPLWEQAVTADTRRNFASDEISKSKRKLALAIEAENKAKSAKFEGLDRFNQLLSREYSVGIKRITQETDCNNIEIGPSNIIKTRDIMEPDFIDDAALSICTNASFLFPNIYERLNTQYINGQLEDAPSTFPLVQALPAMHHYTKNLKAGDLFQDDRFKPIKSYYDRFEKWQELSSRYYDGGLYYYPQTKQIVTSVYALDAKQHELFLSLYKGKLPENIKMEEIREVVLNEYTEIQNCTVDIKKHLNTKRLSYELAVTNGPKRALASTKYFTKECKATFDKREQIIAKFTQQRSDAEKELIRVEEKSNELIITNASQNSNRRLVLNQLSCQIN